MRETEFRSRTDDDERTNDRPIDQLPTDRSTGRPAGRPGVWPPPSSFVYSLTFASADQQQQQRVAAAAAAAADRSVG
ncbi:unnamed protein product [Soboliphyme baturini]|uniref:Uncharacterized protein n=1 Tax=Soboliphyme baturini TaxID=241478 RepID=A0A183IS78_9BILA|nr:unnamed protein product [Soboliphyme baturini]